MTETTIESIESLDFGYIPPCELTPASGGKCSNPAEWVLTPVQCCNGRRTALTCDPCLQWRINFGGVKCYFCNTIFNPTLTAYEHVRRLDD